MATCATHPTIAADIATVVARRVAAIVKGDGNSANSATCCHRQFPCGVVWSCDAYTATQHLQSNCMIWPELRRRADDLIIRVIGAVLVGRGLILQLFQNVSVNAIRVTQLQQRCKLLRVLDQHQCL